MSLSPALTLLAVTTVPVDDPGSLLELLPADGALAWVRDGSGLVGWGEAARLEVTGPERFAEARAWWDELRRGTAVADEVGLPGSGLVAFGSFSFDPVSGSSVLVVPEVVVGHRDGRWWLTSVTAGPTAAALREVPRPAAAPAGHGRVRFEDGSRTEQGWKDVVASVVARIAAGEVAKVVLARDVTAVLERPLDVRTPLRRLAEDYPGCWTFAVDGLVGATPELLVRLEDGRASSRVLAGTIWNGTGAPGRAEAVELARSAKDLEEHRYAVRSVVDALALHCDEVDAAGEPSVLRLRNVMHLASDVAGRVTDGSDVLGLVSSLHPSAAVCGTPTPDAMRVIREVEGLDRGRYTGPVGWLDGRGEGEWGIALRCAEVDPADPRRLRLFAGGGIVAGSQPDVELAETHAKLAPMRDALS